MSFLKDLDMEGLPSIKKSGSGPGFNLINDQSFNKRMTIEELDDRLLRTRNSTSNSPFQSIRPISPGNHRVYLELQDQLKSLKDDIRKKDSLIAQLSSSPDAVHNAVDSTKIESFINSALNSGTSKTELAAMQVKIESLTSQLRESENQIEIREMRIRELRSTFESHRESEARLQSLVHSLQQQMQTVEIESETLDNLKGKSELTIRTLQGDNEMSRERILELESRLRRHLGEIDNAQQQKAIFEKKNRDMIDQFRGAFTSNGIMVDLNSESPDSIYTVVTLISNVFQENAMLKGKMLTLNETLANTEVESKASRETIMRLVSEVGREQKAVSQFNTNLTKLKLEKDNNESECKELKREVELLKERLESTQKAWNATRHELEDRENRLAKFDRDSKEAKYSVRSAEAQYNSFKEALANLLSNGFHTVLATEENIKDTIGQLLKSSRDERNKMEIYEEKMKRVGQQFETTYERGQSAQLRSKRLEADIGDLESRLKHFESEFASQEIIKDGLRLDKSKYLKFMEQLADLMKMDRINAEIGFDMTGHALLARAGQLMKLEADALADRSTHIYNLQRKLKAMKQQLESKDLHLDLLRKKISALEEKIHGKVDLEKEKDGESGKVRKLAKQLEKTYSLLKEARAEIVDLKAHLLEASNLKLTCLNQDKELQSLEKHLEKLERVRQKQAKKIHGLKQEIDDKTLTCDEQTHISDNTLGSYKSELKTTKFALEEATTRERQLLELRKVISRMLGLDINSIAVPDYEIIGRLEKLIQAHQSASLSGVAIDAALSDLEDGYHAGFLDARKMVNRGRSRSPKRVTIQEQKKRHKSLSPSRRDPRQY